jgi:hypothetical protein
MYTGFVPGCPADEAAESKKGGQAAALEENRIIMKKARTDRALSMVF